MQPSVNGLDHLVLTVTDMTKTLDFYCRILGMKAEIFRPADGSTRHALKFGRQKINLHPAQSPFEPKAAVAQPGAADLCFLSEDPVADWLVHLAGLGVVVEDGPVERTGATGTILSVYIRDPDGNLIEVSNLRG